MPKLMPIILVYSWLCCAHGCVYACTVHLYTLTVTVQLFRWPIRASHPSRGHHTHMTHTNTWHRQCQMLSLGSPTTKLPNMAGISKNSILRPWEVPPDMALLDSFHRTYFYNVLIVKNEEIHVLKNFWLRYQQYNTISFLTFLIRNPWCFWIKQNICPQGSKY